MIEFAAFPKIPRLNRECIVTEKLDGTNASVTIRSAAHPGEAEYSKVRTATAISALDGKLYDIFAGSRNRFITPEDDNFGFARWVRYNANDLVLLGEGTHFGEWWGQGIQRGYGMAERRFSLFNVKRWGGVAAIPYCCKLVPVIQTCLLDDVKIAVNRLRDVGSYAVPGYDNPEGVIVYHKASGQLFKVLLENDDQAKGSN